MPLKHLQFCSPICSARWVSHCFCGGAVPWRGSGRLRVQHPPDRWVHSDDHRLHHGWNLRSLHAAPVSHGVPVALCSLPSPTRGLCRWHITPKIKANKLLQTCETHAELACVKKDVQHYEMMVQFKELWKDSSGIWHKIYRSCWYTQWASLFWGCLWGLQESLQIYETRERKVLLSA